LEDNKVGPPDARQLHVVAAKVLMKIMYGARFARPDLLRAVCVLARRITNWDEDCDKRLLRLISYINSTLSYRLKGWINDSCQDLQQQYFSDADLLVASKRRGQRQDHLA
jgi:cytidylate kinase